MQSLSPGSPWSLQGVWPVNKPVVSRAEGESTPCHLRGWRKVSWVGAGIAGTPRSWLDGPRWGCRQACAEWPWGSHCLSVMDRREEGVERRGPGKAGLGSQGRACFPATGLAVEPWPWGGRALVSPGRHLVWQASAEGDTGGLPGTVHKPRGLPGTVHKGSNHCHPSCPCCHGPKKPLC